MTRRHLPALVIGLSLCVCAPAVAATVQPNLKRSGRASRDVLSPSDRAAPVFTADMVEPDAVDALKQMSGIWRRSRRSRSGPRELDVVTGENQRIQLDA